MYIVIVGSGRTGAKLGDLLSKNGHEVVVIDKKSQQFRKLSIEFSGFNIEGDAMENEILKKAKTHKADMMVVTTGSDKVNYMVTQLAREFFSVPAILVRVIDPSRKKLFSDLENVETYSPLDLLVDAFINRIENNKN
ncbi:MAG: potassium channel family protein [Halanaerobiales bacterium]